MKEVYWGYLIFALGVFVLVIMMSMRNLTTTNEENYYLMKEAMESAMVDAVDYGTYRQTGKIRIIKEKFVECFVRRFAEIVDDASAYKIEFYDIYEYPPIANIKVSTTSGDVTIATGSSATFDVINTISGTLESKIRYQN